MIADGAAWRGKNVLVTGHTGFKGSWLCATLLSLGANVRGLALAPSTSPSLYDLLGLSGDVESHIVDVRDADAVSRVVSRDELDVVFHLAAQPLVREGYAHPVETYATNVMGTAHVLEALRDNDGLGACVVVTSDKCYDNREWLWGYRESEPLGGDDPYSSSKGATELVAHAYRTSFFDSRVIATARAGNVIGGGDWSPDRLVPDVVTAAFASRPPIVRNPLAVRPWQHVLEPLAGYLKLAQCLLADPKRYAQPWNFGPPASQRLNVAALATRLLESLGAGLTWEQDPERGAYEAHLLSLDATKAAVLLDWRSRLRDDEMIDWTAHWYRRWHGGENVRELTFSQIAEYASK